MNNNTNNITAPIRADILSNWIDTSKKLDLLSLACILTGMADTTPTAEVHTK